jgi:D-3-phosphoglycerate dehydrogenase
VDPVEEEAVYRVLVADNLSPKGIEILKREKAIKCYVWANFSPGELRATIGEYDGIIIRSKTKLTADIIDASERLKVIGRAGIGVDNIDVQDATRRGILVMNTPRENTTAAAEHTIAMMLAISRKIPQANASTKSGKWERGKFIGVELYGKTLGIIGIGNIGSIVAERAQGLKMNVIAYDPYIPEDAPIQKGISLVALDDLLGRSDFISIHTPLTEETRNLIDGEALEKMKTGVMIINCARGGIVNEGDLLKALKSGKVRGAALDVFENEAEGNNPLFEVDNVICTPHIGAATSEAQENVAVAIADQIVDFLVNKRIRNAVNIPIVSPDVLPVLKPYLNLGEKLGSFLTQISDVAIEELSIEYKGTVAEYNVSPVTVSILRGLLTPYMGGVVNFVNASVIAKDRGIRVRESKSTTAEDFASMVAIRAMGKGGRNYIAGALFGTKGFRIVQINDFLIEAVPQGNMLLIQNYDRLGVIGNIGTTLGNRNVNIATMQFSRDRSGGVAISLLHLDSAISKEVMEELSQVPDIISVKRIEL